MHDLYILFTHDIVPWGDTNAAVSATSASKQFSTFWSFWKFYKKTKTLYPFITISVIQHVIRLGQFSGKNFGSPALTIDFWFKAK